MLTSVFGGPFLTLDEISLFVLGSLANPMVVFCQAKQKGNLMDLACSDVPGMAAHTSGWDNANQQDVCSFVCQ